MNKGYARNLDLNLLRVAIMVADVGSVTEAAARLYLTQPAVSAALRRLSRALDAPLFARRGRGLALTDRGAQLVAEVRPHLDAMVAAALAPARFDAATSQRVVRLGLADSAESWLLPRLLRAFARDAPSMRFVVTPVQFRTVAEAFASRRIDCAVTVADELPRSVSRALLFRGGFVCLFDPRHVRFGPRPTRAAYLAEEHVIVSYNGDLRGVVEDTLGLERRVRCSVATFHGIGAIVTGSALVATVPAIVASQIRRVHPQLRTAAVPLPMPTSGIELLWPGELDADEAVAFVRSAIVHIADDAQRAATSARPNGREIDAVRARRRPRRRDASAT